MCLVHQSNLRALSSTDRIVLMGMGFPDQFINLIMQCVVSFFLSSLIMGSTFPFIMQSYIRIKTDCGVIKFRISFYLLDTSLKIRKKKRKKSNYLACVNQGCVIRFTIKKTNNKK